MTIKLMLDPETRKLLQDARDQIDSDLDSHIDRYTSRILAPAHLANASVADKQQWVREQRFPRHHELLTRLDAALAEDEE